MVSSVVMPAAILLSNSRHHMMIGGNTARPFKNRCAAIALIPETDCLTERSQPTSG